MKKTLRAVLIAGVLGSGMMAAAVAVRADPVPSVTVGSYPLWAQLALSPKGRR